MNNNDYRAITLIYNGKHWNAEHNGEPKTRELADKLKAFLESLEEKE
jgi:hypothetical protein